MWEAMFNRRLYTMLRRYVTFIGCDTTETGLLRGNMHAAAPETVFGWLKRELGVQFELFASPLNCFFPHFCSAFPDVDFPFGSFGSFFDMDLSHGGSYEVGPPYTEEVMFLTAERLLNWLKECVVFPLSFVVFLPDWEGCDGLTLLDGPDFQPYRRTRQGKLFLLAHSYNYHSVCGLQFFADKGDDASKRYYIVPHSTRVYILQNDAGALQWEMTEAKEVEL